MPENEDSLALEGVLSLDDVLYAELAVVVDLSPHVVDQEGLSEVVFIVGEGHGLEVQGHGGATLNVADHVLAHGGVGVRVEELGHGGAVLREVRVLSASFPLLVVVNHVVGLRGEELVELLMLEDGIEESDLVESGLSSLVSDSGGSDQGEEAEVDLPDERLVEHQEAEGGVAQQAASPAVVGAVGVRVDLVQVVSCSHSPLPEVVLEQVVAEVELAWVSLGFELQ